MNLGKKLRGKGWLLKSITVVSYQVELHPFWRQDELVKYCQSKGIHVSAHTPLGIPGGRDSGYASSSEDEVEKPSSGSMYARSRSVHAPMLRTSVVAEIAQRLGRTPAQVHNYFPESFMYCGTFMIVLHSV